MAMSLLVSPAAKLMVEEVAPLISSAVKLLPGAAVRVALTVLVSRVSPVRVILKERDDVADVLSIWLELTAVITSAGSWFGAFGSTSSFSTKAVVVAKLWLADVIAICRSLLASGSPSPAMVMVMGALV